MSSLEKPDPDQYLDTARNAATVEAAAGDDTSKVYHVSGIYYPLCFDTWGIEAEFGDYNAEWLGRRLAELLAEEEYRAATDYEGEVEMVTHNVTTSLGDYDKSQKERYEGTYYEVAIVPA